MHGVTRKETQKRLQAAEKLFRKSIQLKDVNSILKTTKIIGQMKAFYRKRIPELAMREKKLLT